MLQIYGRRGHYPQNQGNISILTQKTQLRAIPAPATSHRRDLVLSESLLGVHRRKRDGSTGGGLQERSGQDLQDEGI